MMEIGQLDALNYRTWSKRSASVSTAVESAPAVEPERHVRGRRRDPGPERRAGRRPRRHRPHWLTAGDPVTSLCPCSKNISDLIVSDGAGHVLMYAPVTSGSEHDPLPIGDWKVTGVDHNPKFHYNPELFWDAKAGDAKTTIQAGPNNPVGVVWIDLSREHYGLHGTPEPSLIGKTTSHGCVRLTNWDAEKLAGLVRPGTKVVFTE
jgi:lipoprotein-anchoring transpeptidase ErfK/SrfK